MSRRGFTLIELITVMLVISVIASIAIPKFASSQDRFDVEATARRIASSLAYARRHAQSSGTDHQVFFDSAAGTIAMPTVPNIHNGGTLLIDLAAIGHKSSFSTDFPGNQLSFSMHGTASADGLITVSNGMYTTSITVFADSGHVSLN